MIHTLRDGQCLVHLLRKTISDRVELIGSLGKGEKTESEHDIDILIPYTDNSNLRLKENLIDLLEPKGVVEDTDWGGWYFHDTFYGNVDVFFTTQDFDF